MNRIKIIKRANLRLPLGGQEGETTKVRPATAAREAAKVVGTWIDEWRGQKPGNARNAFADLFRRQSDDDCANYPA